MAPRNIVFLLAVVLNVLAGCAKQAPEQTATAVMNELAAEMASDEKAAEDVLGLTEKICQKKQITVGEFAAYLANNEAALQEFGKLLSVEYAKSVSDPTSSVEAETAELEAKVEREVRDLEKKEQELSDRHKEMMKETKLDINKKKKEVEDEIQRLEELLKKSSS